MQAEMGFMECRVIAVKSFAGVFAIGAAPSLSTSKMAATPAAPDAPCGWPIKLFREEPGTRKLVNREIHGVRKFFVAFFHQRPVKGFATG
jgi:hypothetical protein